ncbi:hypothetical protein DESA109040_20405 [Deinococcus saxicola]
MLSYRFRLKGVENIWKSEGSEKEKNGFRTWSVEIGAVPIPTRNKRNPYQSPPEALDALIRAEHRRT